MRKRKEKDPTSGVGLHGFYRLQIVDQETGEVVGDTGLKKNIIVSGGLTKYMTYVFAASAGSSVIGMAALGSDTFANSDITASTIQPGSLATSLYKTVAKTFTTRAASSDGDSAVYTATWASGTSTAKIANVALYATTGVQFFAAGTFASSSVASNQAVNLTYNIVFVASGS
jgi:hypothetical protein